MQAYSEKFDKALGCLQSPELLSPTGDRPICYVTYETADVFTLYRSIELSLRPKAEYFGFHLEVLSVGQIIQDYIRQHDYNAVWMEKDIAEEELYSSIRDELGRSDYIARCILEIQDRLLQEKGEQEKGKRPLLLIRDLEMLHPYDKMGRIEHIIYNRIEIPILILYPGKAQGTARNFLNIYTMDGSYRSKNF